MDFPEGLSHRKWTIPVLLTVCCHMGCGSSPAPSSPESDARVPSAPQVVDPVGDTIRRVTTALRAANPQLKDESIQWQPVDGRLVALEIRDAGLTDLSPLAGLPLEVLGLAGNPIEDLSPLSGMPLLELDLERTQAADLQPLSGMPLRSLWLNQTPVADLAPLTGAPLTQLSLLGTKVTDLSPLAGLPLESVWLNDTQVSDLSPLAQSPLVSLTLHHTPVSNIDIVRNWPGLRRLHLGESQVTDLSPLRGLRLTRLIVTPGRITAGWDVVRAMETLTELDVEFREPRPWSPEEFWRRFDAGELQRP